MIDLPEMDFGPKMAALRDDRQRRFAYAMACGGYNQTEAAREAGYSDIGDACKVRGHELMHTPAVVEAIEEAALLVLRGLGPLAIQAAKAILENPKHRAHARIIETVLDRAGYSAKTEHTVKVEHTVDVKELEDLARRLAAESGIDPRRLLGTDANVIDGEVVDVTGA